MARSRYRVTDEKIELVLRLNKMSHNQRAIAKAVNLSQGTVNKIIGARQLSKIVTPKPSGYFNWKDFNNSILL